EGVGEARIVAGTTSGRPAGEDSPGAERRFRTTLRGPNPNARDSTTAGDGRRETRGGASVKCCSAMGATLVKRHASCFIVGKPSAANRAIAPSRISRSQGGAPAAPLLANAWKSLT